MHAPGALTDPTACRVCPPSPLAPRSWPPCTLCSLLLKAMQDPEYAVYLDDAIAREKKRHDGMRGARCAGVVVPAQLEAAGKSGGVPSRRSGLG